MHKHYVTLCCSRCYGLNNIRTDAIVTGLFTEGTTINKIEWFIAFRYLSGKRKYGSNTIVALFSAIGVFLGSWVLVIALSIANGFEKEVRDRIVGTLAHAKIMQYHNRPFVDYDSIRTEILKHPEVIGASPYIMGKGGVEHDQVQEGAMIIGIDAALESTVTDINKAVKYGEFNLDSMESKRKRMLPGILLGIGMADKMGVRQGSEIILMSLVPVEGEIDPIPKMMRFVVTGIFETGMYEYDLNLIYISLESAQNLFETKGAEGIQVRTTDLFRAGEIANEVKENLGGYPFKSIDWLSQNRSLFQWMKLEKLIIFIVISLIMVVASFNIVSSLIRIIIEKRREIGILMSMGASSGKILKIFMLYGSIIGLVGSTVGTGFGVILCYIQLRWNLIPLPGDIYFINKLPVLIRISDILAVYFVANIICFLAATYPAWRASQTPPADSIRYE